jgi:hypothetical protein
LDDDKLIGPFSINHRKAPPCQNTCRLDRTRLFLTSKS